jgi:hypothetical protein
MLKPSFPRRLLLASLFVTATILAQNPSAPSLVSAVPAVPADKAPVARGASDGSIITRRDARAITLKIPGTARLDRGPRRRAARAEPVAYQVALQYPQFENADRDFVVNWARPARLAAPAHQNRSRRPTTNSTSTTATAAGCRFTSRRRWMKKRRVTSNPS